MSSGRVPDRMEPSRQAAAHDPLWSERCGRDLGRLPAGADFAGGVLAQKTAVGGAAARRRLVCAAEHARTRLCQF
ncbi:hypothetical protein DC030_14585 [Enterococcus faecalis]|nr:hypothetical protein DC030_14585 [Enterococcus faecalis]